MAVPIMRTVKTAHMTVEYFELELARGSRQSPPVILMHGWPDSNRAWLPFLDIVARNKDERLPVRFLAPQLRACGGSTLNPGVFLSGQQGALAWDLLKFMDALGIKTAYLMGMDWGGRACVIVSALWPERVAGLCSMGNGYNLQVGIRGSQDVHLRSLSAYSADQERRWWYQYYLHSERGFNALKTPGTRKAFQGALWKEWSPNWNFKPEDLELADSAWSNAQFPEVVCQSYRHRHNSCAGDPSLEWIEELLAPGPRINVPSVLLHGEVDGVDPYSEISEPVASPANGKSQTYGTWSIVTPSAFIRDKFRGKLEKRVLWGVGHFVPQEMAEAVFDALKWLVDAKEKATAKM